MKRFLACMMTVCMAAVLLAGCGNKDSAKDDSINLPTLRVFFGDDAASDDNMVAEAVSKITAERIGANVEFIFFGPGEYSDKIPLLLASNEKMDLGFDANWINYAPNARKGAYLPLNDYLQGKNKPLYDIMEPIFWQGATVDGKIYGVPTFKEMAGQLALYAETEFLEDNGIDASKIKTLADAEVILAALKKYPERPGFMIDSNNNHQMLGYFSEYAEIDKLAHVKLDEPETVVNYYETQTYKDFVYLMRDWFNKGYIASDVVTIKDANRYMQTDGNRIMGMSFVGYAPYNEISMKNEVGVDLTPIKITDPLILNSTGSTYCVYKKSANPDLAVDFLQLWNTTPEVKNLITYGIEGRHYTLVDGKVRQTPDFRKLYYNQNWRTGNVFISYLLEDDPEDKYEKYKEWNSSAKIAPIVGFYADETGISDKVAACNAVIKEYSLLLNCGVVDPDEYLPKFIAALKSAGSDDVINSYQEQYATFRAAQ